MRRPHAGWFKKKEPHVHDWEYVPGTLETDYDILKKLQRNFPVIVDRKANNLNINGDPVWDEQRIIVTYPGMVLDADNWRAYGVRVCLECKEVHDELNERYEEWAETICAAEEKERKRVTVRNDRMNKATAIYKEVYSALRGK